jgi:acyl carrier protein
MSEMSDAEILEIVKEQICEQLDNIDPNVIKLETEFIKDLKADSLDVVELVLRLEDKFDIEINDGVASKIQNVEDSIDYIKRFKK